MPALLGDTRFALRLLFKRPGFTAAATVVLALGIGANAAVFSVVNALLLRPLAGSAGPGEILGLYNRQTRQAGGEYRAFSYPDYVDIRDSARSFSGVAAHDMALAGLTEGSTTRRTFVSFVTANYFETLGVGLARGRTFSLAEERIGQPAMVTIVSDQYWRSHGSKPDILGSTVRVSGRLFTVVGVAPPGMTGTTVGFSPEFWMPLGVSDLLKNDFMRESQGGQSGTRSAHALIVFGRLRPAVSPQAAEHEVAAIAERLAVSYPGDDRDYSITVHPLARMGISTSPQDDSEIVALSAVLMLMSAIVLLVACLNLANMLLARGTSRRKEMAIRLSIGASRVALVRQLLTEGFVLSAGGGLLGLVLAYWATSLLVRSISPLMPFPILLQVAPDWRVLAATFGFATAATLFFALGPALRATRPSVVNELREQAGEDRVRHARLLGARNLLLASQVALSLALLVAGALFVRGAVKAAGATPGFPLERGLVVEVDPGLAAMSAEESAAAHRRLLAHLRTMPGVEAASFASLVPFGAVSEGEKVERAGAAGGPSGEPLQAGATYTVTGADYFRTLGLRPVRGREFTVAEAEGSEPRRVAIIDEPLAKKLFPRPGEDPVGQFVQLRPSEGSVQPEPLEVVGVVAGLRDDLFQKAPAPHIYVPFSLNPRTWMNYHLRIAGAGPGEGAMLEQVRREIGTYDSRLPVLATDTLRGFVAKSVFLWLFRSAARIFTTFGLAALLLALVGIYGVNAYHVARRSREIGIRIALGATPRDIVRLIVGEAAAVTIMGLCAGLLMAVGIGWTLQSMLYGVSAFDPVALTTAPVLLAASALAASYLPARRVARMAPSRSLRE
jgi:predicted permease